MARTSVVFGLMSQSVEDGGELAVAVGDGSCFSPGVLDVVDVGTGRKKNKSDVLGRNFQ